MSHIDMAVESFTAAKWTETDDLWINARKWIGHKNIFINNKQTRPLKTLYLTQCQY